MSGRGTLTTPNSPMISKSMMLGIGICSPRALPNKRYSLHLLPYTSSLSNNQPQIYSETSASVTTKGVWYPDKTKATDKDPPLYLHISATTQEILDKAIQRINDLIAMDLGPLVEDRRKDFNRERVCTVFIPPRPLLLTNTMVAQMARGEDSDQPGIAAQFQCSSQGGWPTGATSLLR